MTNIFTIICIIAASICLLFMVAGAGLLVYSMIVEYFRTMRNDKH